MIDKTFLKMLWIKEYYLKNMDYSNILYIEPFLNLNVPNFKDIFEEENLNFNFLSWDDSNNDYMFVNNFDNWDMIPDSNFDVIISYNYFKLLDFDKILSEIYRILNDGGFFCLFVPYLKEFNSEISFEYFINKLILLIKSKGFVIRHFSDNSLIKNSDLLECCLICTKI